MRYPRASTEPLDIIRVNECDANVGLATARFQALWNEIERLRAILRSCVHGMEVVELADGEYLGLYLPNKPESNGLLQMNGLERGK